MDIIKFDISIGLYLTELTDLVSDFHNHPAMEIVIAQKGDFSISIKNKIFNNLKFAIIGSNKDHQLKVCNSKVHVLIVEHQDKLLIDYFIQNNLKMIDGYYLSESSIDKKLIDRLIDTVIEKKGVMDYDPRVQRLINYLKENHISYFDLKKKAQDVTCLSYSRISHLFKSNVGISLKKYLVWCKLRNTVHNFLRNDCSISDSFHFNGFYDQPHFNNNYKAFIGTSPSKTYR